MENQLQAKFVLKPKSALNNYNFDGFRSIMRITLQVNLFTNLSKVLKQKQLSSIGKLKEGNLYHILKKEREMKLWLLDYPRQSC